MKKTKKRVLGLLGLVLVIITTIFAAFLPGPEASAEGGITSVTDTISVRVVGSVPDILNVKPINGSVFIYPDQDLSFDYENVEYLTITIRYTDKDDVEHIIPLLEKDDPESFVDYIPGSYSTPLDLLAEDYGYGEYRVEIVGIGFNDVKDFETVEFALYPVVGEANEADDGKVYLDLQYDTENENINTIGINIYDENGNLVNVLSPITVNTPDMRVELPFAENNLPTGNYRIEITAYNAEGEALYKPYITYYYYEMIPVPNTGALFSNLNISRTDYLVTGLIIFFLAAILGIVFIVKGRSNKSRLNKKRR